MVLNLTVIWFQIDSDSNEVLKIGMKERVSLILKITARINRYFLNLCLSVVVYVLLAIAFNESCDSHMSYTGNVICTYVVLPHNLVFKQKLE